MKEYKLSLPYPPTVNTYWRHARGRNYISEKGTRYRSEVIAIILNSKLRLRLNGRLKISIIAHVPDKRVRDIDNLFKAPLDALVHAGMINDDGQVDDLHIVHGRQIAGGLFKMVISEI